MLRSLPRWLPSKYAVIEALNARRPMGVRRASGQGGNRPLNTTTPISTESCYIRWSAIVQRISANADPTVMVVGSGARAAHRFCTASRRSTQPPSCFVVEGERDAESLRSYGFVATTNAGGAKAPWLSSYTQTLTGREVILIPDNDDPGRQRVLKIARALLGHAARIIILEIEGAHDVSDWFAAGHSELELQRPR